MGESIGNLERIENPDMGDNIAEIRQAAKEIYNHLFRDDYEKKEVKIKDELILSELSYGKKESSPEDVLKHMFEDVSVGNDVKSEESENQQEKELKYEENGTRELTEDERQELKDLFGWSDDKIDKKCRIDEEGVIHYKTDCQDLEGKTAENGVLYERKTVEYNGKKIEGVFPVFDSKFTTKLPDENLQSSNSKQFSECNKNLKEAIADEKNNPGLKEQFTKEELEDIENVDTPRGYTWHHTEEPGKMQLVKTEDHDRTIGGAAHTGGNSIWGNKSIDKQKEGETF